MSIGTWATAGVAICPQACRGERTDDKPRGEWSSLRLSRGANRWSSERRMKLAPTIPRREGGKPKVNRRSSECRALVSSCLGKRPEVERRVDSSSTSEAASRLLGRAKRPLGDEGDACYRRDARKPSGELRDSFKVDSRNTMEELRNIFASSCVEAAARKLGCSTSEMYRRMKRVGLIHGFIIPGYEALHSQSRELTNE